MSFQGNESKANEQTLGEAVRSGAACCVAGGWRSLWPFGFLAVWLAYAIFTVLYFPNEADPEFPQVVRPTLSPWPPAAYRLAEPGDTIDRAAMYAASVALIYATVGLIWALAERTRRRTEGAAWGTAWVVSFLLYFDSCAPYPTWDGWHGWNWRAAFDSKTPTALRIALGGGLVGLLGLAALLAAREGRGWVARARRAEGRVKALLGLALILVGLRLVEWPDPEPIGYWPRWCGFGGIASWAAVLLLSFPRLTLGRWTWPARGAALGGLGLLVAFGGFGFWHHRPLGRFKEVEAGRLYMSAMPTAEGLELAHARHGFKTIINLFPEATLGRHPDSEAEQRFAWTHGIRYLESPGRVELNGAFLRETLDLTRDPAAWPILVHCHACMDRTPAWVGFFRYREKGWELKEVWKAIEQHRGLRPKATVFLLYHHVIPRLGVTWPDPAPFTAWLAGLTRGVPDPYDGMLPDPVPAIDPIGSPPARLAADGQQPPDALTRSEPNAACTAPPVRR